MLEGAVETIEGLKTKVKIEMAAVKVIDLTKAASSEEHGQEDSTQVKEKINYLIVKAKDQVNDAFNVLFSKESNLNKVVEAQKALIPDVSTDQAQASEKLKLGTVKLTGVFPPLKKVVNFTDSNLRDFKQNLTIFAH